jgi:dolichol-phosphate mannosyltransferase
MKFSGKAVSGFTTVIMLILIIGSLLLMSIGVIGHYIARIYEETKARPRYLVQEKIGVFRRQNDRQRMEEYRDEEKR